MSDPQHGDHSAIIHRLGEVERRLETLRYVSPDLLDALLAGIRSDIGHLKEDVRELEASDRQRRTQVYGAILGVIGAVVIGLIQAGVLG